MFEAQKKKNKKYESALFKIVCLYYIFVQWLWFQCKILFLYIIKNQW